MIKNRTRLLRSAFVGLAAAAALWLAGAGCSLDGQRLNFHPPPATNSIVLTHYHGWKDSVAIRSADAEVVVVPALGRVMLFRFKDGANVLWENEALFGRVHAAWDEAAWRKTDWVNFGGDKSWPSPEGDWTKFTKRDWRPPPAFDGLPWESRVEGGAVIMTSPVDPYYGIRVRRRIELSPSHPVLTITTDYERVSGAAAKMGVWVVTQFAEPEGVFVPLPPRSIFTNGYTLLFEKTPPSLRVNDGLLSLQRDGKAPCKIGTDAGTLLWVGKSAACRVDSPRSAGAEYPDRGSSAEIYTNDDPLHYVELEMLGPLSEMKPGHRLSQNNTYTLFRRTEKTAEAEARKILRR